MQEIWKPITGFENLYEISNLGNVRSLERIIIDKLGRKLIFHSVMLVPRKTNRGYYVINLSKNGKFKNYPIHRLVAETFIDNSDNLPCVDHINGDKTLNTVDNLRWCTYEENSNNPITLQRMHKPRK
jgi:hypothetical protein